MKPPLCRLAISFALSLVTFCTLKSPNALGQNASLKPIRALLIAGGCCHDYAKQQEALCKGIQARANVRVDVYWTDNSTTAPVLPLYSKLNWADDYDIIIHDECASDIKDPALVNRIVQTHQKIPAVHLHCAMHSFRTGGDVWFKHLGLQSTGHGPQEPIQIEFATEKHPITETLSNWTTGKEELYNNVKVFDAQPLAIGKQMVNRRGTQQEDQAIVAWVNEKQGARSFSTSLGHNTETVADPRYLELVTRGLLWACDKLTPEYLVPYEGDNKTTFIDKNAFSSAAGTPVGTMPSDATLVKITASSTQTGNARENVVDGNKGTRWCADGPSYPAWIQLEFEKSRSISAIDIDWESANGVYRYLVEGSADGKTYQTLLDRSMNTGAALGNESFEKPAEVRFVRVTGLGSRNGWCSIREIRLAGEGISKLWLADPKSEPGSFKPASTDPYTKSGNIPPRIEPLSPENEAAILRDVRVPDGFEVSVFAAPPAVNYPVFVAASVDGTVYVSSDGNGSLGRDPMRGRVLRLRDTDNDGRADETKVFCEVDAPRGLVWDKDRLYLMHPPHLSVFFDRDLDGVAEEQQVLVRNLAFDYDKRPADHTTNGLSLGVDGWLYIAGGDFGFMNATGTDGRQITHRGGGVLRVRPDGTGLEIYSTGTRNILEVAISPEMEMFARDNTNDGGGWDVRMHHFTGNDDHGYPRLYKNFSDEAIAPLADYGGGSGCGAVYIDEPGFGKWNHAPFTADWGTGAIYWHQVKPAGATYQEVAAPTPFIRMTRPTDADVDGNSRVYAASWKGATFNWNGPNVGYIVRVQPKGFQPEPQLNYTTASAEELVREMESPSYRRRVEASRELTRRGDARGELLLVKGIESRTPERTLVQRLITDGTDAELIQALNHSEPIVVHTAIRTLASRKATAAALKALDDTKVHFGTLTRSLGMMHDPQVVTILLEKLKTETNQERRGMILATLCRLYHVEGEWKGDSWGTRPDTRGPYYQPESWSESDRIGLALQKEIANSDAAVVANLLETMSKNRIESKEALNRLLELAKQNASAIPLAVSQLAKLGETPDEALEILQRAVQLQETEPQTLEETVIALSRSNQAAAFEPMWTALERLPAGSGLMTEAFRAFLNAKTLESQTATIVRLSEEGKKESAELADMALLTIASKSSSPEVLSLVHNSIDSRWRTTEGAIRLMGIASRSQSHYLDDEILAAANSTDAEMKRAAENAIATLKIRKRAPDTTPKVAAVSLDDTIQYAVDKPGDVNLGLRIFAKAKCVQCHTVRQDEVQKGPYLGNIVKTYKRPDLAAAILDPNKTIAQGFITNIILTTDEETFTGFITDEQNDRVKIRDAQGVEHLIMKDQIEARKTSNISSMPTGLMNEFTQFEFSSLLDYLESLSK